MNYLKPCSTIRPFGPLPLTLSIALLLSLGSMESTFALEEFASFSANQVQIDDRVRENRDRLNLRGSFALGGGSNGINPVMEPVEVTVMGAQSKIIFSETIPPGSFKVVRLGRQRQRFSLKNGRNHQLDVLSITQNRNGTYAYRIRGNRLNFECCLDQAAILFRIGDDGGALDAQTKAQIPLSDLIPPTIGGLHPAMLSIPVGESRPLTADIKDPDPNRNMTIVLTSSNSAIASVPEEIVVSPGKSNIDIPVTGVTEGGPVIITALLKRDFRHE